MPYKLCDMAGYVWKSVLRAHICINGIDIILLDVPYTSHWIRSSKMVNLLPDSDVLLLGDLLVCHSALLVRAHGIYLKLFNI